MPARPAGPGRTTDDRRVARRLPHGVTARVRPRRDAMRASPAFDPTGWTSGQRFGRFDTFGCLGILQNPSEEAAGADRLAFERRDPGAGRGAKLAAHHVLPGAKAAACSIEGDQDSP